MTKRNYDSTSRRAAAESTRQAILEAARNLFSKIGYTATTMPAIAHAAGVAMDTVYATVGKKPALFRLLIEMAISGTDKEVPAEERDYVHAIRAEASAARKLQIYAAAVSDIQVRLAPLFRVLQSAAPLDSSLNALWKSIGKRRAKNMRLFAADLASTGELRKGLAISQAADIIWSLNSSEFYLLLVEQRGWSREDLENWLGDALRRLLLES